MSISTYVVIWVWIIFSIIRYARINIWAKVGLSTIITGIWCGISNDVMNALLSTSSGNGLANVDFTQGFSTNNVEVLNANVLCTVIIASIVFGMIFIIIGIVSNKIRKKK